MEEEDRRDKEFDCAILEGPVKTSLSLEKLVFGLKLDRPQIELLLGEFKSGLRVQVYIQGLGMGFFDKKFEDKASARKAYDKLIKHVEQGNYVVEYLGENRIKLGIIS